MDAITKRSIKINGFSLQTIEYYAYITLGKSIDNHFKTHQNQVLDYNTFKELKRLVNEDVKKETQLDIKVDDNVKKYK